MVKNSTGGLLSSLLNNMENHFFAREALMSPFFYSGCKTLGEGPFIGKSEYILLLLSNKRHFATAKCFSLSIWIFGQGWSKLYEVEIIRWVIDLVWSKTLILRY